MDDPRWLRMVTVGLVLAVIAVIYFLFTGGFSVSKTQRDQSQADQAVQSPIPVATFTPTASPAATPSAYQRIAERTQGGVQTLPNTGFPVGLAIILSASAIISGLSLRRFPK